MLYGLTSWARHFFEFGFLKCYLCKCMVSKKNHTLLNLSCQTIFVQENAVNLYARSFSDFFFEFCFRHCRFTITRTFRHIHLNNFVWFIFCIWLFWKLVLNVFSIKTTVNRKELKTINCNAKKGLGDSIIFF